ncbi:hypothetical protein [Agarilytica rhodophyticola]|uniref:hypothetical protein n=1 Tax=Agarilytica rhodophyticola TaxID=1737490 RepID=UPI001C1F595A|nr:hypothetical protein [Agarilytica rhodophyticola]
MNNDWTNFNDADDQVDFDIIPKGTLAKVRIAIKPGGYDNPDMGWTGGYATQSQDTGAIYLNCEFTVLEGEYARRKIWSLIGLHSPKSDKWTQMGRAFVKAMLCSARGIRKDDFSNHAMQALSINSIADLDGLEFLAKIGVDKGDKNNEPRNIIAIAVTPENKQYAAIMGNVSFTAPQPSPTQQVGYGQSHTSVPPQVMNPQNTTTSNSRPSWVS